MQPLAKALGTLQSGAAEILGRQLTGPELEQFSKYFQLLQKWQRVQRLVGSIEPGWIVEQLFLDSLLFLRILPPSVGSLCDVGSGAGFPGIPIRIVSPHMKITLIESRQRRVSFLSQAVRVLDLRNATVVSARVETPPPELIGSFGAAVLRCAGPVEEMIPAVSRLVSPGGTILCSGPPQPYPLPSGGEWREAVGSATGRRRLFAVFHV